MANLTSRTAFTGTLAGSDIFYGITTPGGTPQEWKIPLSKLADLYATAAQGDLADSALQPADVVWVEKAGDTMTGALEFTQPAGDTWQFMSVSPNDPDNEGFNWNIAASNNPSISRRNVIMNWGYNNGFGGGSHVAGEPSFYEQIESHYAPGSNPQFEYHWDFFKADGSSVRPLHLNCIHSGPNEGDVNFYWYSDQMNWGAAHDGQFIMLILNSGATLATSQFKVLVPTEHRQLITFANTDHAGLRLNNLTTAQRDALTASAGMLIYNTTTAKMEWRGASAWNGLGTIAALDSPLPIANGGSGQTSQQAAIDALTAVSAATNEYVLTKDTATGNAIWKAGVAGLTPPVAISGTTASLVPLSLKTTDDSTTNPLLRFLSSADAVLASIGATGIISTSKYYQIGADLIVHISGAASNSFLGRAAGNLSVTGTENTGVGSLSLNALTSGGNNVGIGTNALLNLTTGSNNVAIGRRVLSNFNGSNAVAIGSGALGALTSGTQNVAVGVSALGALTTNGGCTAVGYNALQVATGLNNTAIGDGAGVALTTGTYNTFLGASTTTSLVTAFSSIAIGYGSIITASRQMVIGWGHPGGNWTVNDVYIGGGVVGTATNQSVTINATGGSGTDKAGADLSLAGGKPTGAGTPGTVIIKTAPSGASGTALQSLVNAAQFDADVTAGNTRFLVYDVDNGTMERVSVGVADSGGAGFKVLRIPN